VRRRVTTALSTLVSEYEAFGPSGLNDDGLGISLRTLLAYSGKAPDSTATGNNKSPLPGLIKELSVGLHLILTDTVKMRAYYDDHEMLIDLMHRLARSYARNPNLRLTWLHNIANRHMLRGSYLEAAQCLLHCAALVIEHLHHEGGEGVDSLPVSVDAFMKLSTNVWEESEMACSRCTWR